MYPCFKRGKKTVPEEIIRSEILTRLPIKSVVRFQSVCKSWESLFSDPKFVKAHTMNQDHNYHDGLIALGGDGLIILSRSKETRIHRIPFGFLCIVGSINGLICAYGREKFSLWNPVISKFKRIDIAHDDLYDTHCIRLLGFGFDKLRNDFKLVNCYFSAHSGNGAVYSSNSDSWTQLIIPDSLFPNATYQTFRALTPVTIVNNSPYWSYSNYFPQMRRKYTTLVKFEAETNEFRLLPEFDYAKVRGKDFDFVNIKDCFAVMVYKAGGPCKIGSATSCVDVYSLDEGSGVWSKMYTMGPINFGVPSWNLLQGFKYGGDIVFNNQGKLLCYDPKTNVISGFPVSSDIVDCFNYTSTLVFLPGMNKRNTTIPLAVASLEPEGPKIVLVPNNYVSRYHFNNSTVSSSKF